MSTKTNNGYVAIDKIELKRATKTRKTFAILTSVFLFLTVIFLVLVEIGSTSNKPVIRDTWFIKLNTSHAVPRSVPQSTLIQTAAEKLGLHDFYQAGLWNYCEGDFNKGITNCSTPETLYWFDPVHIVMSEIMQGHSIKLPHELSTILHAFKAASQCMFGLFLAGTCLSFVLIFLAPLSIYTKWNSVLLTLATLLNALAITAAGIIATVLFNIMRQVFINNPDVNIGVSIGTLMLAFMWIAAAFAILTCIIHFCMMCCCASRRDLKKGRKIVNEKSPYENDQLR